MARLPQRLFRRCSLGAFLAVIAVSCMTPDWAVARSLYVVNTNIDRLSILNSDTNTAEHGAIATGASPDPIAMSPDGSRIYVGNQDGHSITVIDAATRTPLTAIPLPTAGGGLILAAPRGIAVTPDGGAVLVVDPTTHRLTKIDPVSNQVTSSLTFPAFVEPRAVAITPDGSRAYVSERVGDAVGVVDLASMSLITAVPLPAGSAPRDLAITPNGSRVYAALFGTSNVAVIDTSNNSATIVTPAGAVNPYAIAVAPNGSRALVADFNNASAWLLDTATNQFSAPFASDLVNDAAYLPTGDRAYVTGAGNSVLVLDGSSGTQLAGIPGFDNPLGIVATPVQGPTANFISTVATAGAATDFDGSSSADPDGTIARYDWNFGDGSTAADGGPKPSHVFAKQGTYQVSLTVTDSEGASTERVFTGQTVSLNGSAAARKASAIAIAADKTKPKVKITYPKRGGALRRRALKQPRGTASDAAGIKRVQYSLAKRGKRCRFLRSSGRLRKQSTRCSRLRFLKAKGTTKWRSKVSLPLPRGHYVLKARATDNQGNRSKLVTRRFAVR